MSRLRYERAIIQSVQMRDDFITEVKFFGDGWSDLLLFKTYNVKDAYVLARIMEQCGASRASQMTEHEVELVLVNRAIIAVKGYDDTEFYPMPSSELYYYNYEQLVYEKEELEEIFS